MPETVNLTGHTVSQTIAPDHTITASGLSSATGHAHRQPYGLGREGPSIQTTRMQMAALQVRFWSSWPLVICVLLVLVQTVTQPLRIR